MNESSRVEAPATPKRSPVRRVVRLVGPLLLVVVILRLRDSRGVVDALVAADMAPVGIALLLNVATYWFKIRRTDVLLSARGKRYERKRAWLSFLASAFAGLMTPGRLGDVLRAHYFRHDLDMPYPDGIALLVVDRLCDVYVLIVLVVVAMVRFGAVLSGDLAVLAWVAVLVTALAPLALLVPSFMQRAMRSIYRKMPHDPSGEGFERFLAALKEQRPSHLVKAALLTTAAFGVNHVQGALIARSLHLDLAFFDVVCLLAITSLLSLLPVSVSGVGVRELFFSLVFPTLHGTPEAGVLYGLSVFLVIYVGAAAMGFVGWLVAPPPPLGERGSR
jgi:glycosyltransferase 2 family protein